MTSLQQIANRDPQRTSRVPLVVELGYDTPAAKKGSTSESSKPELTAIAITCVAYCEFLLGSIRALKPGKKLKMDVDGTFDLLVQPSRGDTGGGFRKGGSGSRNSLFLPVTRKKKGPLSPPTLQSRLGGDEATGDGGDGADGDEGTEGSGAGATGHTRRTTTFPTALNSCLSDAHISNVTRGSVKVKRSGSGVVLITFAVMFLMQHRHSKKIHHHDTPVLHVLANSESTVAFATGWNALDKVILSVYIYGIRFTSITFPPPFLPNR